MSLLLSDIKVYAAAVFPEDDVVTNIGGDHDFTKKCQFSDFIGAWQVVSDSASDTSSKSLELFYRDTNGDILSEVVLMDGTTFATASSSIERMMKGTKNALFNGNAAIISQTPSFSGTLPVQTGLSADQIKLPAGASSTNGAYQQMVFRGDYGGLGDTKLAEIIDYDGTTKIATLNRDVTGEFDDTTEFEIYQGMFFDNTPNEISDIVRMDYDSAADPAAESGGVDRDFYIKVFFEHTGSILTATSCVVREAQDPTGLNTFGLDDEINLSTDNGAFNRQTAPAGITFDNADKDVPGEYPDFNPWLMPGDRIGVWIKLHRAAGATAIKSYWMPQFRFQTT